MTDVRFEPSEACALELDQRDPLAGYRNQFLFPHGADGRQWLYLCGHSLGLQPKNAKAYVSQEMEDWARFGVEGHFHARHPWMPYHQLLTGKMAGLLGALPQEVVVMNSLTVNLHLMMVSFYRPVKGRHKILVERGAFPSDQYAVASQISFHGFAPATSLIELTPRPGESCLREEDIDAVIDCDGESIALILLGAVNYATGQALDLERITTLGHKHGCIVGFDLAHAAGNLPLQLHKSGPDFAVWCSYKYLNGGPGCPGGCFVHERHGRTTLPRFAGWWGHDDKTRFEMPARFQPMPGAEGWQLSNPPILALAALRSSIDIFHEVGMDRLRAKSLLLTGFLEFLLRNVRSNAFSIASPLEPHRRGAQLSLRVLGKTRKWSAQLAASGVIGDWREPDIFRVAPVPLYNSFQEVYGFVEKFVTAL
ncbi:MAG TPA: kynureninase [Candidatus Sulfotelmatobacter sp.]